MLCLLSSITPEEDQLRSTVIFCFYCLYRLTDRRLCSSICLCRNYLSISSSSLRFRFLLSCRTYRQLSNVQAYSSPFYFLAGFYYFCFPRLQFQQVFSCGRISSAASQLCCFFLRSLISKDTLKVIKSLGIFLAYLLTGEALSYILTNSFLVLHGCWSSVAS